MKVYRKDRTQAAKLMFGMLVFLIGDDGRQQRIEGIKTGIIYTIEDGLLKFVQERELTSFEKWIKNKQTKRLNNGHESTTIKTNWIFFRRRINGNKKNIT